MDMQSRTCKCGMGKASRHDEKCGHCRSRREQKIVQHLRDGWSLEEARPGRRLPKPVEFFMRNRSHG